MPRFLMRDRDPANAQGYRAIQIQGDLTRRQWGWDQGQNAYLKAKSFVPWGLTHTGEVVYSDSREAGSWNGGRDATTGRATMKRYDTEVSKDRRRMCESVLGMTALQQPLLSQSAVDTVSKAITWYLRDQAFTNFNAKKILYDQIGHYFFTTSPDRRTGQPRTGWGFGRISQQDKRNLGPNRTDVVWNRILDALNNGRLDQKLSIHDAVGRKLLPAYQTGNLHVYEKIGRIVRSDWFDDEHKRGRKRAPVAPQPNNHGGIASAAQANPNLPTAAPATAILRHRGVDQYVRDKGRDRTPEADDYYDDADYRNLLFGAGISGTTGSLLQAARVFGIEERGEAIKTYLFAILGYLVGGGMHSAHESLAVASRLGVEYSPGIYDPSLPQTFLTSQYYQRWRELFYDVVVLGRLHWRYNPGVTPSHMNPQLDAHLRAVNNG